MVVLKLQEVKQLIKEQFAGQITFGRDKQEMCHHAAFVWKRAESFVGREGLLRCTMANIAAWNGKIVVVHGDSGSGAALCQSCGC